MGHDTSDLRAWYREDLANTLKSVIAASYGLDAKEEQGFNRAIVALCMAFGINPKDVGVKRW